MTIETLSRLIFEFVKFTNTFWGVYATVTIALLGWVFGSKMPWSYTQRVSISIAYISISIINCLAQIRFSRLIDATLQDMNFLLKDVECIPNLKAQLLAIQTIPENGIVFIYTIIAFAVIYILFSQNKPNQAVKTDR